MRRRLPAVFELVTPAGRSLVLLGLVCYLLDTLGGWPVFQLLWLVCVLLMVVAVAFALLPGAGRATLQLSPPRTMAGDDAQVHVSARSAGFVPVPSPLISVPAGRRTTRSAPDAAPRHAPSRSGSTSPPCGAGSSRSARSPRGVPTR